jgi:biotin/lipoate A/B protein ligase family protein
MPLAGHTRGQTAHARALDLPPPFQLVTLREAGDAFVHACAHAAELGAGTLVYVGRFDIAEFAVVLEPDDPAECAWRALYAGMVGLADALATLAPPRKPIAIEWPDAIRLDGGLVGGGRLAWPEGADAAVPPPWLVFGAMIRTAPMAGDGAGPTALMTALEDDGFGDVGSDRLVEGFARHFMRGIDHWREAGFAAIANNYVSRLERERGVRHDIGDGGELLVTRVGRPVEHRWLGPRLAAPSWLDPHSGGPCG